MMSQRNIALLSLIVIGIATRFLPHAPNFTAVGAAALLGGVLYRSSLKASLVPLVILFISDLVLNNIIYAAFFDGFQLVSAYSLFVYAGFLATVLIGRFFTRGFKVKPLLGAGIVSAFVFYLITNFGSWLNDPIYTRDMAGLAQSYIAGLPFLGNQLLGTGVYGLILFSAAYFWIGPEETSPDRAHA